MPRLQRRRTAAHDCRQRNSRRQHVEHLRKACSPRISVAQSTRLDVDLMALRDIFKFRELPEGETSKPFLEHLEDLRWTIVKMAITLVAAMVICFAFRSTLVRVMQAPMHEVDPQVGALRALGITDSFVISFHLAFYAGIVLSFPLLLYFLAEFVLPALTAMERRFLFPAIAVSFGLFLLGVLVCYFWLLPKMILFFFRDTQSLGWM